MKRILFSCLSLALLSAMDVSHAQSSVTLYGEIDDAISFVHNSVDANGNNANQWGLLAGNLSGSRWGMKGTEDLGGGLKGIFQLEGGFDPNNGKMGSYATGTKLFGRQAYVGLAERAYGTFTLGRQYDPIVDLVQPLTADYYFGSVFTSPGDVDNNDNSSRTNNAVKYLSPVWSGFQIEGMYAFGGVAGATGAAQTWSGAATWAGGPFGVAAGYLRMNNGNTLASRGLTPATAGVGPGTWNPNGTSDGMFVGSTINSGYQSAKSIDITSAAAQYAAGPYTFNIRYSFVQYKPDGFSAFREQEKYHVAGGYAGYQASSALLLGLGYIYQHGAGDTSATYHQVSLGADYALSKRTDLYLIGAYQHANGTQRIDGTTTATATASIGSYGFQSASSSQELVALGIRHKF
ncbi:porin [Paraburkholderia bengalensis]|uniref:Porin n=1 Tax=Paraburkholderia bengalensis TaxID=2747562 RepID=A0ABU8J1P6_9BURK